MRKYSATRNGGHDRSGVGQAVRQSIKSQAFIAEKSTVSLPAQSKTEKAKVIVSGKRSLEAAEAYAKQGKKVCVLNSPRQPTPAVAL